MLKHLNKKNFKTRTLTAIVFAAVMLIGLFSNFWIFFLLFSVIHFGCWVEYFSMIEKIHTTKIGAGMKWRLPIYGFALFFLIGVHSPGRDEFFGDWGISKNLLIWFFLLFVTGILLLTDKNISAKAKWMSVGGLVYISLSLALLINIRGRFPEFIGGEEVNSGLILPCAIIFSIWINDTMAYIVGSLIGKTPFSKISPNKTWEGTAGGAILCVIVIALLGSFIPATKHVTVQHWIAIPIICAVFGTLGDLYESKLKRLANIKDSGSFMPGHGGFLDRFDSLLVAVPFVWLYLWLFF